MFNVLENDDEMMFKMGKFCELSSIVGLDHWTVFVCVFGSFSVGQKRKEAVEPYSTATAVRSLPFRE